MEDELKMAGQKSKSAPRLEALILAAGLLMGCGGKGQASEVAAMEAKTQIKVVAQAIDIHRATQRELPGALSELVAAKRLLEKQLVDPWGRQLRYDVKGPREFELCSAGPDEASPADDICHTAH